MGDSEGGRSTQDAADILDRVAPGRPKPTLAAKPPFAGAAPEGAAKMAQDAERLYNEAMALGDTDDGPASASPALILAYNAVVEALEMPGVEVAADTAATINFATTTLAQAAAGRRGRGGRVPIVV